MRSSDYMHDQGMFHLMRRSFHLLIQCSIPLVLLSITATLLSMFIPTLSVIFITGTVQAAADFVSSSSSVAGATAIRDAICFVALTATSSLLGNVKSYANQSLGYRADYRLKMMLVRKSSRIALEQYENADIRDVMQRADGQSASQVVSTFTTFLNIIQSFGGALGVLGILLSWNWLVALLTILSPIPSVIATIILSRKYYQIDFDRATQKRESSYFQYLLRSDETVKEIKTFSLSDFLYKMNDGLLKRFQKQDLHYARISFGIGGILNLLGIICYGSGIVLAVQQTMTVAAVGRLTGYLQAISSLQTAISSLVASISTLFTGMLYTSNIFEFLDLKEKRVPDGDLEFPAAVKNISFEKVNFHYPGTTRKVLSDISFSINTGETVALVGANGSGKTTIAKLLLRLYEVDSGEIVINGEQISSYNLASYRHGVSALFQDFVKYERTLRDNIAYGDIKSELSDSQLEQILQYAGGSNLSSEIGGMQQVLGRRFPKGRQLSIGQWQKVSFARAIASHAPVLVLDEPTAALDARSESRLLSHLKELPWHPTSLVITHRRETIEQADRIIFIQHGEIEAIGAHQQLLDECPSYREMLQWDTSNTSE